MKNKHSLTPGEEDIEKLRAAIIGLGQVGSRFDEDVRRKQIWSHAGAYLELDDDYDLVLGIDIASNNREAFKRRCPNSEVAADLEACEGHNVSVFSVCTPPETHFKIISTILDHDGIDAIWSEKPFVMESAQAKYINAMANEKSVPIYVSHTRRWMPLWIEAKNLIDRKIFGNTVSLSICFPNRIWSIGSHAIDLVQYLAGNFKSIGGVNLATLKEDNEETFSFIIQHESGAVSTFTPTGLKRNLYLNCRVFCEYGVIEIDENDGRICLRSFEKSQNFSNYFEPSREKVATFSDRVNFSPFLSIAKDIARKVKPRCSGADASQTIWALDSLQKDAPNELKS
ncbi:Gfo/Idh/MocA family oxidoreductase [Alphaproteobacteria bacterium]|nr:Gfo/Idh/MocA family oxidoreductase [Alphaproteobacteria bacterium]